MGGSTTTMELAQKLSAAPDDHRGWILCAVSGAACVVGSFIICVDLLVKYIPRFKHFSIRDNVTFLSASLSLSFGVMIYSALDGILPEASIYLIKGGNSPQMAKLISIGCFMVGVVGLSIVAEIMHRSLPSSIVHCEHGGVSKEHGHGEGFGSVIEERHENMYEHVHTHERNLGREHFPGSHHHQSLIDHMEAVSPALPMTESTPLLTSPSQSRQPSLRIRIPDSVASLMTGITTCTGEGPCHGFSETMPCDRMCLPHIKTSKVLKANSMEGQENRHATEIVMEVEEEEEDLEQGLFHDFAGHSVEFPRRRGSHGSTSMDPSNDHGLVHSGHHHVPKNEFLSIGLQTSLAIALHKIPEGFIMFATNHANSKLGFAVCLAIAIHNLSEGFVMSLSLFLALKSRKAAILWASVIGGLSQPAGALCAHLWFKSHKGGPPSSTVYGILFAITAGIMSNVALQLYGQAVSAYHNHRVPMIFAFMGMGVLGMSFAIAES